MEVAESDLDDINRLLNNDTTPNALLVKKSTLQAVLGLSVTLEGCLVVTKHSKLLLTIFTNIGHRVEEIAKLAGSIIINLSAEEAAAETFIKPLPNFNTIHLLVEQVMDKESVVADQCATILSNLARHALTIEGLIDRMSPQEKTLSNLLKAFSCTNYNAKACNLDNLASLFSNLTQSPRIRRYFLDKTNTFLSMLGPFIGYQKSVVRRRGVLGTLMNCCFETTEHSWLLGEEVDLLGKILLPLAGNEEFDDEDTNKLPIDIQYLSFEKERDTDILVRKTALNALYLLCATRDSRKYLRDHNAYIILRELHKWEKDSSNLLVCENVVNVLIRTEDEIGVDEIKKLDVPDDLQAKFERMDSDYFHQDN